MFLFNNQPCEGDKFSEKIFENGFCIYEVIRVFKNKPIFLKDNLERLNNSLKKSNISIDVENLKIPEKLTRLIQLEKMSIGNLKYVLHFIDGETREYVYPIPHSYPTASDYREGIKTITHETVRENPEVKYINPSLRDEANRLIKQHQVYEILLVNHEGYLTEGSRSNLFFIKADQLYTAPGKYVLPGTSRKRVFDLCQRLNIRINEQKISLNSIETYDVAFLTGTSPLILPIRQINEITYSPANPLLETLMKHYFELMENS